VVQQQGLPGLEPAPAPTDETPTVGHAFISGYLARYRGRPDTDIPYRAEPARAAYMAGWRACARLTQGGYTTPTDAGSTGEKED
jgi:ribosome modulation factor